MVLVEWHCTPIGGLREAMLRLSLEAAEAGEYDEVDILSTPKTTTAFRSASPHFKIMLRGDDNGRRVSHEHHVKIAHRDASGRTWRYQIQKRNREESYDYTTLVATNSHRSNSPRRRREQREAEAARLAAAASQQAQPDGWYADPWAGDTGKTWRWFQNGQWSGHTR
ncbi:unnamed protein product [Clonostachys byssicola]|uniref:DUF2510 domain-containing protein n=1 Tax=Clonostachys byssicola TaxID=160290 RepID=A0A9N9U357_9HYPO|nr:unnamed protein product [Clonostachys byssicola]